MIKKIYIKKQEELIIDKTLAAKTLPVLSGEYDIYIQNNLVLSVRKYQNQTVLTKIKKNLDKIKFLKNQRTSGLITKSLLFGYSPRNPLRRNYCNKSLGEKNTELKFYLDQVRIFMENLYKEYYPDFYSNHLKQSEKILEDWRFEDSVFSSGIINKNNELAYHKDKGNIKNCLSNMLVIKNETVGGNLILPNLGYQLEFETGDCVIFNGQDITHGVSPIIQKSLSGARYSIVYYTLQQLWNCLPLDEEIKLANKRREVSEARKLKILMMTQDEKQKYIDNIVSKRIKE